MVVVVVEEGKWGSHGEWLKCTRCFFWDDDKVLKLIMEMDTQLCKYTKNCWIIDFKWVNGVVYKLYLNKAIPRKKDQAYLAKVEASEEHLWEIKPKRFHWHMALESQWLVCMETRFYAAFSVQCSQTSGDPFSKPKPGHRIWQSIFFWFADLFIGLALLNNKN